MWLWVKVSATVWSTQDATRPNGAFGDRISSGGISAFGVRRKEATFSQWVKAPPGKCSSKKQSEQLYGPTGNSSRATGHGPNFAKLSIHEGL